ncbi:unnamed protein product [Urochloa humidicola]
MGGGGLACAGPAPRAGPIAVDKRWGKGQADGPRLAAASELAGQGRHHRMDMSSGGSRLLFLYKLPFMPPQANTIISVVCPSPPPHQGHPRGCHRRYRKSKPSFLHMNASMPSDAADRGPPTIETIEAALEAPVMTMTA